MFVCDKAFEHQARGLMSENAVVPVGVRVIVAGKFRRYSHLTRLRQLLMPKLVLANIGDMFKTGAGVLQSVVILSKFRPDVVFAKGGYVCLPVGVAARVLNIPLVIHDSDARPGLTNRVLARWADRIGTGAPLENYNYPVERSTYVGVPISSTFHPYSEHEQRDAKKALGFSGDRPLLVVTGGGLGAVTINHALVASARRLIEAGIDIYHVTGKKHYDDVVAATPEVDEHYIAVPFVFNNMADALGAADIVVSRASATFIQELAGIAKPAILVPSRALGDQRKNATVYAASDAAIVLTDDQIADPVVFGDAVIELIGDQTRRSLMAENLHKYARPHAAHDVAQLVVDAVRR